MRFDLPAYPAFPLVDEMNAELDQVAAAHPDLVRVSRIGTSRLGEPLRVLTIGDGPADAVVIGGPHPNEPVGSLTVSALIKLLCEDAGLRAELGCRWHIIPCVDPDGARLNEGWYGRPGDRRAYVDHFYRPAMTDQVEWTFPLISADYHFDRVLPETAALMRLMDDVRPSLVYSLHNGEYQGAFFYINRDDKVLAERLAELPREQGIPLHHGDPELPGAHQIAPGVYRAPVGTNVAAAFGSGGSSADYAAKFGALHLVTEVPYWTDDRVSDQSAAGRSYAEILAEAGVARRELIDTLQAGMRAVARDLTVRSPFRRSTESTLDGLAAFAEFEASTSGLDRPATVADEFGGRQMVHLLRLRSLGTFLRMLDAEFAAGNVTPAIREQRRVLGERFDQWYDEAEADSPGQPIEIRKLVAVQLGAALVTATALSV